MSSTPPSSQEFPADDVLQQLLQVNTAFLSAGPREALARLQDHFQDIASGSVSPSPADQRMIAVLAEHYLPRWLMGMPVRGDSPKPDSPTPNAPTVPSAQTDRSPLDELLARYDDVAQISAGQLSFVYKAKYPTGHENAGQDVILKVPVPNDGDSDTVWQAERHALQTLKPVRHLHIIGMNDAHVLPYPCIELEYMPGGDLGQEEGSVFEPVEAATTALLIAKAVQTAHGLGLYHHDIRPENILYDHKRQPKLSDWGMSRQASATGSVSPSDDFFRRKKINPNYAAPEQLDTRFGVSQAKTDVYQLGLLLYDMLTGFEETATRMSNEGALNFTPSSLAEQLVVGPDIDGILEGALRKSVFERITIDDFGQGLAEFLDGIWEDVAVKPTLPEGPQAAKPADTQGHNDAL